jgi:4-alpha-glucanotransferase
VLPEKPPSGYHRLRIEWGRETAETLVIAAPRRAYRTAAERLWGIFLPLYALRTERSAGGGDFTDLRAFAAWTAARGGSVVATLPMLAAFLDEPCHYSPYTPVSRLFWNELYLDTSALPGSDAPRAIAERAELAATDLVDYRRQFCHNRALIERAAAEWPAADTEAFVTERPEVTDYARFRATAERERSVWRRWPQRQRDGDLQQGDYDEAAFGYHLVAQQLAERQLSECATDLRSRGQHIYLDYPVGVHPDGYDVWRNSRLFALDASTGAPPDTFFTKGQDWGFHPFLPEALRRDGYAHFIATLRHHLRDADILRIDHVMGLHRLFWIGHGLDATDGVYVRYPAEEMYAILCLESHRHQATIAGEDLGTVPDVSRRAMARHRIGGSYVVEMEARPDPKQALPPVSPIAVASTGTHDMPTFAGFLHGLDIADRVELGHLDLVKVQRDQEKRAAQAAALSAYLTGKQRPKDEEVVAAATKHLAASPASLQLISIEDLWLETAPQNVPGTTDERPNWRRRARYRLEEWDGVPGLAETLRAVDRLRKGDTDGGS